MKQNPTHQYVTNMLKDQWPASIEVGDANKEAKGKAVMMGPRAMKDTKERSLKNMGEEWRLVTIFGRGTIVLFSFTWLCGVRPNKGVKL